MKHDINTKEGNYIKKKQNEREKTSKIVNAWTRRQREGDVQMSAGRLEKNEKRQKIREKRGTKL